MEPYPQGFMNVRPLVIQPIDNQEPCDQAVEFPLSNHYEHPVQAAVTTSGYLPIPYTSAAAVQHIPPGHIERRPNVSLPAQDSTTSTGLVNTGKALEYSWHVFDGQTVPAITPEQFVPVKIIEQKLLSFFPNTFPLQLRKRPPLRSIPMKLEEINLLNSLNKRYKLGVADFKDKDVMVKLDDFTEFYENIKLYYPQCVKDLKSSLANGSSGTRLGDTFGSGWIQVNNTVLPYVKHGGNVFLPVDVIVNAAKLPVDESMTTVLPPRLYETLNEMCTILKKNIMFDEKTAVLPLHILERNSKDLIRFIQYLPSNDPKKYAKYIPEIPEISKRPQTYSAEEDVVKEEYETKPVFENVSTAVMDNAVNSNTQDKHTSLGLKSTTEDEVVKENVKPKDAENVDKTSSKDVGQTSESGERSTVNIDTILCEGNTLQCLHRKEGTFVLMEALLRVFFPELSIEDFIGGVEVVLGVDIPDCTSEEERAFIAVYHIPSEFLKCKKLVTTESLEKNLCILRRMFLMAFDTTKSKKKAETVERDNRDSQSDVICID